MKNELRLSLALIFLISLLSLVSSANQVTLLAPAQDGVVNSTTYYLNASMDTNSLVSETAVFFYDYGGANTTICTASNNTATAFNCSWDTTAITDRNNIIVWVNISNGTADISLDSSTGVDIDQGNPVVALYSTCFADNLALVPTTSFTVSASNTTIGLSSCTIWFENINTGSISSASSTTGSSICTNTSTPTLFSLGVNEAYYVTVEGTDGNGDKANSSSRTLRVTPASAGGGGSSSSAVKQSILGDSDTGTGSSGGIGESISNFFNSIINFFKNLFS